MLREQTNFVSSMTYKIKKQVKKQKAKENKMQEIDTILQLALDQFEENLRQGKVQLKSTADLERLVKLKLLLQGEPTDIVETRDDAEVLEEEMIKDVREELGDDFEKLTETLFQKMNERNDNEERE